ncbi:TPA: AlwI family type II restriction endonuclease [Streptococcus suis]|uniref:AlwI family type II restriction endonuclease n=1 Tax=Bacilli TaxID=91061 RepID=UPI001939A77E
MGNHLSEIQTDKVKDVFSLFVTPSIHSNTQFMFEFVKARNVDIFPCTTEIFVGKWKESKEISEFIKV